MDRLGGRRALIEFCLTVEESQTRRREHGEIFRRSAGLVYQRDDKGLVVAGQGPRVAVVVERREKDNDLEQMPQVVRGGG